MTTETQTTGQDLAKILILCKNNGTTLDELLKISLGPANYVTGVDIDLDEFNSPGKYYFGTGGTYANMPSGVTSGYLTVNYVTESGPVQQILIDHNARIYLRTKGSSSASWTAWTTIANLSDMPGVMTGATSSQPGTSGIVPAPAAGKQGSYLMGNGTWGQDASVLAAISAGQIGNAKLVSGSSADLNDYTSAGFYYFSTSLTLTNAPAGLTYGYLHVFSVSTSGIVGQYFWSSASNLYARTYNTMSWGQWVQITDSVSMANISNAVATGQINGATVITGTEFDVDTLVTCGLYYLSKGTPETPYTYINLPDQVVNGWLQVITTTSSTGPIYQILYSTNGLAMYYRRKYTSTPPEFSGYVDYQTWSGWTCAAGVSITDNNDLNSYINHGEYYLSYYELSGDEVNEEEAIQVNYINAPSDFTSGFLSVSRTQSSYSGYVSQKIINVTGSGKVWYRIGTLTPISGYLFNGTISWGSWISFSYSALASGITNGQIGSANIMSSTADINTYMSSGVWYFTSSSSLSNAPSGVTYGFLSVFNSTSSIGPVIQIFYVPISTSGMRVYIRSLVNSSSPWSEWVQTSAAYPSASSGAGQWTVLNVSAGSDTTLPSGGTWAYFVQQYTSGSVLGTTYAGVAAGGTTIARTYATRGMCWRIA